MGEHLLGMNTRRAGCGESRTSGSEGGPRKRAGGNAGTASRSNPYTEHLTREGKVYCAVVLDTYSRRVVGWSMDASPTAALVTNALGMVIDARRPAGSTVIHSDRARQYGSWAFTRRAQEAGRHPSMGAVGTCYDNALMGSFWSRVQVELLDRQVRSTRLKLATALLDYLKIFHNRQRRHSSLGMLKPIDFETRQGAEATITVA